MQRTQQGFSKTLSQAVYFQQSMQQKKADSKKTPGEKSLIPIQLSKQCVGLVDYK